MKVVVELIITHSTYVTCLKSLIVHQLRVFISRHLTKGKRVGKDYVTFLITSSMRDYLVELYRMGVSPYNKLLYLFHDNVPHFTYLELL